MWVIASIKGWRAFEDKNGHEDPETKIENFQEKRWEEMPGKCSCRLEAKHSERFMFGVNPSVSA